MSGTPSGAPVDTGNRTVEIVPPPEMGPVTFERMTGGEALGAPFEFEVDVLSVAGHIATASVLGKPFSVALSQGKPPPRWFNGIVTRLAQVAWTGSAYRYRATLRPTLWLMSRTSDCRIFQNTTIPDLVMRQLQAHGVTVERHLGYDRYPEWEFIVQYNETDLNFVSRLMEQEGIFYYFVHERGKHTLWLVDGLTIPDRIAGHSKIRFATTGDRAADPMPGHELQHETQHQMQHEAQHETIDSWSETLEVQAGAYAAKEYDFEDPGNRLTSTVKAPEPPATADVELFEYPGHYVKTADRDEYAARRLEERQRDYQQIHGTGNARGLAAGFLFTLQDHPAASQNREYRVTAASYALTASLHTTGAGEAGPDYRCRFTGIDGQRRYRPPFVTPRPRVQGPQTAVVVGPKGEEIWTDKHGRVKVQFHWDRRGKKDEKSSCMVRVSQLWAGSGWGAMHIPRIGHEVVVDFLEGDPDRPIITGRVYNGTNVPPYALGGGASKSTIRSHSTKGGGPNNYNELCFEDKLGAEQVYLQAEKDLEILVKNDEHRSVVHDRRKEVGRDETVSIGHDESITIGGDRTETVARDETIAIGGNRTETVAGAETVTIGGGRTAMVAQNDALLISGARVEEVAQAESITIGGTQQVRIARSQSVDIGGPRQLTVGQDDTITIEGRQAVNIAKEQTIDVGHKLSITAGEEITFKTGEATIVMKKNGDITIKGKNISLAGSGDIAVNATSQVAIKGSKIAQN